MTPRKKAPVVPTEDAGRRLKVQVRMPHPTGSRIRAGITFTFNPSVVEVDEDAAAMILADEHLIVEDLDAVQEDPTTDETPPQEEPAVEDDPAEDEE